MRRVSKHRDRDPGGAPHAQLARRDRQARALPGVIAVLTHDTAPRLPAATHDPKNPGDRVLQLLQDDKIWYADQPIAVAIADTLERAQHAAAMVTAVRRRRGAGCVMVTTQEIRCR